MKISEVEKMTGLTAKAIRLYEEKGLISVVRRDNSYRDYGDEVIDKLKFIRTLREMGVPLAQICLHFNGVITLEELLNNRKAEMEKENIFHQENYNKCVDFLRQLQPGGTAVDEAAAVNPTNVFLGIDIGTTTISAVIMTYTVGEVLETYTLPGAANMAKSADFAEYDAEWILTKAKRIIDYLIKIYPNIKSIGITGQMHGMLYISKDGRAVSPFYNWQDGRANRKLSQGRTYCEEIFSRTGYICNSGYAFATMFYNAQNCLEPEEAVSFCSIMDYIAMRLTDNKAPTVHPSNAASFGLYDIKNGCFDLNAVEKLGLSRFSMPDIAKDSDIAGHYKNIPVSVPIGDNAASFFGSIKAEKTSALVNFGTGSQVSIVADKFQSVKNGLEIRPYLFGKYLICGSALCGGKAYAVTEKFFAEYVKEIMPNSGSQYEIMNRLAQRAYDENRPLSVSTLFCGTRQNPFLRGSISDIDDVNFTPGNLILGVLCGMTDELKQYFDCMNHADINHITASGNAVKKNAVLQKLIGDIFETGVYLTNSNEEAAIGCALYGGVVNALINLSDAKKIIVEETKND